MARIDFDGARIVCPTLDLRRVRRMRRTLTRSADDIRRGKRRVVLVFAVPVELDVRLAATVELIDALARELVSAGEQLERWWQFMSELGASLAGRLASQIQGVVGHETRRRELADEGRRLGDPLLIRHAQLVERHLDETLRILGAVGLGLAYRLAAERRRITETKRALAARVEQLALTRERIGGHRQMLALIADVERSRHRARDTEAAFGQFESLIDVTLADFGRRLDELCMIDRDIEDVFLQCGRVYREVEVFATRAVGDATEDAEPIVEFDGLCATVDADSALHGLVASLGGAGSHTEEARFDLELLRTTSIRTSASALLAELERRLLNPPTGQLKAGPTPEPVPPPPHRFRVGQGPACRAARSARSLHAGGLAPHPRAGSAMILEASHVRYDEADGALEVDLRPSVDVRLRFGAWHAGLWCQRRVGAEWVDELHDPKLEVFGALETIPHGHHDAHPVCRFVAHIPDACRERLSAFRECQWTVLRILRTRAGMQLATSAPNLMWLLAGALADAGLADVSIAHVLAQRRHVMLAWILGRNMEPRHVRLLERIAPSRRGPHERARICRVLTDERLIDVFRHAEVVTSDQIDAALGQSPYLGFRCVTRALVSDEPWQAHRIRCLIDATAWTGKQLGYSDAAQIIQSVRTPVELTRLNRRWDARRATRDAAEASRKLVVEFGAQPFPPAPIPGTQDIVHVATVDALVSEGTAMRHCVGLFAQSCVEGRAAVYSVLAPERATLLLTRDATTWTLARVAGRSNCVVSDATLAAVNAWLGR